MQVARRKARAAEKALFGGTLRSSTGVASRVRRVTKLSKPIDSTDSEAVGSLLSSDDEFSGQCTTEGAAVKRQKQNHSMTTWDAVRVAVYMLSAVMLGAWIQPRAEALKQSARNLLTYIGKFL